MTRINTAALTLCVLGALPMAVAAQSQTESRTEMHTETRSETRMQSSVVGPILGDRELSISGTGSSDQLFNSGNFGVSGDIGWYLRDYLVAGIRQSINYASISGENITNDFWNGSTRGYVNYHFLDNAARPFVGTSLGAIYGDGVSNSFFAGLETGLKYYVQPKTYFLGRIEYQFLFNSTSDVSDSFQDDGAWAYTVGMGYNF